MLRHKSFARFVPFPENQSGLLAVQDLARTTRSHDIRHRPPNPLFLHGPPGAGKSHLVSGLAKELAAGSGLVIKIVAAAEFREPSGPRMQQKPLATNEAAAVPMSMVEEAREADFLIVEDLQHLPLAAAETLVQIIDHRLAHERPMVFTAATGPRHLAHRGARFPARLTNRLAAGLVVAVDSLKTASRQRLLEELAQRCQLALPHDIALWLARNLTAGGRQLEGAIKQLETLNNVEHRPLGLKSVAAHFRVQVDATRPTMERIASQVGAYFRIDPRQLQSRRRSHNVLWPRQIGMYLARQLTALSLTRIGAYFSGRDHTTVLHACRKVERAMKKDAVLSGAVRQIHAELA